MSTRKRPDDDFTQEILAHIELETERLIDEGTPPDEARVAARRRFGNVTSARERYYESGRVLWLDHLVQDVRGAARSMRRYPIASLVAVTVARVRNWRDNGHADNPERRLPQAARRVRAARTTVGRPGRVPAQSHPGTGG